MLVFDLDPGAPATIVACCQAAGWLQRIFGHLHQQAFPKTSGSKGLQVYVPLNTPATYDQTKAFAHALARVLERARPESIVSDMKKSARTGKVFLDWSQNDDHKTTICVYSLRAQERPTVSTPLQWDEVSDCLESGDPNRLKFTQRQTLERVEELGELFAPVLTLQQSLPPVTALAGLEELLQEPERPIRAKPRPISRSRPARRRTSSKPAA